MKYSSRRVLMVSELRKGDILHCGQVADGICMPWHVAYFEKARAIMRVGNRDNGTLVAVTGHEIRELEMYRAADCPYCEPTKVEVIPRSESNFVKVQLEAGITGFQSSFWFPGARRLGVEQPKPGAANYKEKRSKNGKVTRG